MEGPVQVDSSLDNILDVLKLLAGIGRVASDNAQMLGLLVFIEALIATVQLASARVTGSNDLSIMLADLQRLHCNRPAECILESSTGLGQSQLVEARWHSLSAGFLI